MVMPTDYYVWGRYFPPPIRAAWKAFLDEIHNYSQDTFWDDLRFPLLSEPFGTGGRILINFAENTLDFATNARYPEEPSIAIAQIEHRVAEGLDIHPHLHWMQEEDNDPNWLLRRRYKKKGQAPSAWVLSAPSTKRVFTYSSGEIHQMTEWPALSSHDLTLSDLVDLQMFRDTANVSTLFSGADPYTITARASEMDLHVQIDQPGSSGEYTK